MLNKLFSLLKLQYLQWRQDHLIFNPHHRSIELMQEPETYGLDAIGQDIIAEDGIRIHVWHKRAEEAQKPVCIFFHGNTGHFGDVGEPDVNAGYDRRYRIELLKEIQEAGLGYVAVSLRGFGVSDKVQSSEEGFVKDTRAVIAFVLDELQIESERIVLLGESLGGAVAMIAAEQMTLMDKPPALVATVATFRSMKWAVLELHPDLSEEAVEKRLRHHFDSEKRIANLAKTTHFFVMHPEKDEVVPKDHSEVLANIAEEAGLAVTYETLAGEHITWDPKVVVDGVLRVYGQHKKAGNL